MKPQVVALRARQAACATTRSSPATAAPSRPGAARHIPAKRGQMFSCSGQPGHHGLRPALRDRGRRSPTRTGRCVAFVGDGGFTMLMGEFATAVKYQLPIKVVIIKNNTLGQIKWEQMVFLGNPEYGVRAAADRLRRGSPRPAAATGFTIEDPGRVRRACCDAGARHAGPGRGRGGGRSVRAADAAEDHASSRPRTSPSRWRAASPTASKIALTVLVRQGARAGLTTCARHVPPAGSPGCMPPERNVALRQASGAHWKAKTGSGDAAEHVSLHGN